MFNLEINTPFGVPSTFTKCIEILEFLKLPKTRFGPKMALGSSKQKPTGKYRNYGGTNNIVVPNIREFSNQYRSSQDSDGTSVAVLTSFYPHQLAQKQSNTLANYQPARNVQDCISPSMKRIASRTPNSRDNMDVFSQKMSEVTLKTVHEILEKQMHEVKSELLRERAK